MMPARKFHNVLRRKEKASIALGFFRWQIIADARKVARLE